MHLRGNTVPPAQGRGAQCRRLEAVITEPATRYFAQMTARASVSDVALLSSYITSFVFAK